MSDELNWKKTANPNAWITKDKFLEFMQARGVSMVCERCNRDDAWWIDTGADDGYVPRIAAMPTTVEGKAATTDTYQMPVVRALCFNCGNVRIHAMQALQLWKATGFGTSPVRFTDETTSSSDTETK